MALTATGAPAGAVVTITPQTLNAGDAATDVTLTIQVPAQTAAVQPLRSGHQAMVLLLIGTLFLPLRGCAGRNGKLALRAWLLLLAVTGTGLLIACGSTTPTTPQPQNYTVTVTATSGSITRTMTVQLTVQK